MSSFENGAAGAEQKSSVQIAVNAKGDAQPTVKIYEGCTEEEAQRLSALAVNTLRLTQAQLDGDIDATMTAALLESARPTASA